MAARATTSEEDRGSSTRGIAARTHSAHALRVPPSSPVASGPMSAVCCGVGALTHAHRLAVAAIAAISLIRFLRFMIAPWRPTPGLIRTARRRAIMIHPGRQWTDVEFY